MPGMTRILTLFTLVLLLALPGTGDARRRYAQEAFDDYNNALRWNEIGAAWGFVDPETKIAKPMTDLERKRFDAVQFTNVTLQDTFVAPDGSVDRIVELRLIGKYTQAERSITDHQHWRWDAKAKRYWLVSGLPDITAAD